MAYRLIASAALTLALSQTVTAGAEISDPTRPPPGYGEPSPTNPNLAAPPEAALNVSSLFLMGNTPYALVDGQIVRPGDPLGNGKVARIDASGVWIRVSATGTTPAGLRQLKWLPEVVKTPAKARMEKK